MARPRKVIDFELFKKLCHLQCTCEEIAGMFECSPDTIDRWCKRELNMGYAEAFKIHSAGGKISLRRHMFRMAERNAAVAIWLSKQYLGMREPQYQVNQSNEGSQLIINIPGANKEQKE